MTEETLPLAELLAKAGDGDFLRSVAEAVVQLLMETDVDGLIGAGRHERSGDRIPFDDFPEEAGQVDGTPAHAIERLYFHVCERAEYTWMKVADPALLFDTR